MIELGQQKYAQCALGRIKGLLGQEGAEVKLQYLRK